MTKTLQNWLLRMDDIAITAVETGNLEAAIEGVAKTPAIGLMYLMTEIETDATLAQELDAYRKACEWAKPYLCEIPELGTPYDWLFAQEFWVRDSAAIQLSTFPIGVKILYCQYCQLTALPELPVRLLKLSCSYNNLTVLPELPATLKILVCDCNELTALPELPATLGFLDCAKNKLIALPSSYNELEKLEVTDWRDNPFAQYQPRQLREMQNDGWKLKVRDPRKAELFTLTSGFNTTNSKFVHVKTGQTVVAEPTVLGKADNRHTLRVYEKGYLYCTRPKWVFATTKAGRYGWSDVAKLSDTDFRLFNPFMETTSENVTATAHIKVSEVGVFITLTGVLAGELTCIGTYSTLWGEQKVFATPFKGLRTLMRLLKSYPNWVSKIVEERGYAWGRLKSIDLKTGEVKTSEDGNPFNPMIEAFGKLKLASYIQIGDTLYAVASQERYFVAKLSVMGEDLVFKPIDADVKLLGSKSGNDLYVYKANITKKQFATILERNRHTVKCSLAYVVFPKHTLEDDEEMVLQSPFHDQLYQYNRQEELGNPKSWGNYTHAYVKTLGALLKFLRKATMDECASMLRGLWEVHQEVRSKISDVSLEKIRLNVLEDKRFNGKFLDGAGYWENATREWIATLYFEMHRTNVDVLHLCAIATQAQPMDIVAFFNKTVATPIGSRHVWGVRNQKRYSFLVHTYKDGHIEYERTTHGVYHCASRIDPLGEFDLQKITAEEFATYQIVPLEIPSFDND